MLPKISHPRFDLVIPSTGEKVKFRPFTVREEKLLLMAREANDIDMVLDTYRQIITNCVDSELDVATLTMFDIEYFFLKLRAKSVSNISTIVVTDPEDEEDYTVDIDLDTIEITRPEGHETTFMLTDTLGIRMKYPTFEALRSFEAAASMHDDREQATRAGSFATIRSCIDCVFEGETVYHMGDVSPTEVDEFISDLNSEQLGKIRNFMETMPRIEHTVTYKRKDGTEGSLKLEGLQSFF